MKIEPFIHFRSNKGFTLVEILATITLLGIIIVTFIPFFTQYAIFTSKTEENLDAINLAEQLLYESTTSDQLHAVIQGDANFVSNNCDAPTKLSHEQFTDFLPDTGFIESNKKYYPEVFICQDPSLYEGNLNLYEVKVAMYVMPSAGSKQLVTETYDYVALSGE